MWSRSRLGRLAVKDNGPLDSGQARGGGVISPQLSWQLYSGEPTERFSRFNKLRASRLRVVDGTMASQIVAEAVEAASAALIIHLKPTIVKSESSKYSCKFQ